MSTTAAVSRPEPRTLSKLADTTHIKELVIPPCPQSLIDLQALLRKPDADLSELQSIVNTDVGLAAALVGAANSPLFARSQPVESVEHALSTLGMRNSAAVLTRVLLKQAVPAESKLLERFWENSARRAISMAYIARQLYDLPPDLAYTVGLFCHVGQPIMLQSLKGYDKTLTDLREHPNLDWVQVENERHRTDHAVVGALAARAFHMPATIVTAIALHHDHFCLDDESIDRTVRTLVATLRVTERVLQTFNTSVEDPEWTRCGAACLAHLKVTDQELVLWSDAIHEHFNAGQ